MVLQFQQCFCHILGCANMQRGYLTTMLNLGTEADQGPNMQLRIRSMTLTPLPGTFRTVSTFVITTGA